MSFRTIPDSISHYIDPNSYVEINSAKNRYDNVIPLKKTAIKLKNGEYINANKVDLGDSNVIVTQAPLEEYLDEFWMMIWENETKLIGMFTPFTENETIKACKYWPDEEHIYGNISVRQTDLVTHNDFYIRIFVLRHNNEKRIVTHFHYDKWLDFCAPTSGTILPFLEYMRQNKNKCVIHCSAGLGRSGVICAIYRCLNTGEDVEKCIEIIRKDRTCLVQTYSQFKFIKMYVDLKVT